MHFLLATHMRLQFRQLLHTNEDGQQMKDWMPSGICLQAFAFLLFSAGSALLAEVLYPAHASVMHTNSLECSSDVFRPGM
jgi:hypothetical protein